MAGPGQSDSGSWPARLLGSPRARLIAGGCLLLIVALALGGYLYKRHRTGSIYHPHARFIPQPTPTRTKHGAELWSWPLYGYTADHTRFFPAPARLFPPFRPVWVRYGNSLLEFPPVIQGDRIFQLADDGVLAAIDLHNGHTFWQRRLGSLSAAAPAAVGDVVYATVLARTSGAEQGQAFALADSTGHILWSRPLPSPSESSPLVVGERMYFGSQSGTVYALDTHTGDVIWTYQAEGAVKASPTLSGGVLYFGDYSGHIQAISAATGHRIWDSGSEGALFGSGTFYSTAAVMYGRVFLGNTDGRIYAYDARTGALDWAVQTGAYVYSSPAVVSAPGLGPTIYSGSYDGTFYAINARSGHIDWTFDAGGKISGSATIIGQVVYFADLGTHRTYGLGISTGRIVVEFHTGSFDPVVSDGQSLFLTGSTGLYGLEPVH